MKKKVLQCLLLGMLFTALSVPVMGTRVKLSENDIIVINNISVEENEISMSSSPLTDEFLTVTEPLPEPIVCPVEEVYNNGWTTTRVNVRTAPGLYGDVIEVYDINTPVEYTEFDDSDEWYKIKYDNENGFAFMHQDYISDTEVEVNPLHNVNRTTYNIPNYSGNKTWMSYKAVTARRSPQYRLLQNYSYTGKYGIRVVDGIDQQRYCVALGSKFTSRIGQYFDLILANGTVIPCVLGDQKADNHTDSSNTFTIASDCCSEFIIDRDELHRLAKRDGDMSSADSSWNSPVSQIIVYDINIFD